MSLPLLFFSLVDYGRAVFGIKHQPFTERQVARVGVSFLFVYPCCKDNDEMNGERERVGENEREREREGERGRFQG